VIAHTRLASTNAMRNEPPPHSIAIPGNLHMFAVPTAIPIATATKANLLPNASLTPDQPQFFTRRSSESIDPERFKLGYRFFFEKQGCYGPGGSGGVGHAEHSVPGG